MSRKNEILLLALPVIMENILQTLLGTTAITARAFGAGDREKVNRTVVHSMALALVLGIAVGLVCCLFSKPILRISGAEEAVLSYALPYYLVVTVPSAVLCLQLVLSACLRAVKDTRTPMYVTGGSNILNIGLNLLCIRMGLGIFGLGLATTLSRAAGAAVLFLRLKRSDSIRLHRCSLQRDTFHEIAAVGIPAGMEKLIMRTGQLVYNAMILSLGTAAYVAHNVAGTIESYSYIPAMGFGLPGVWSAYALDITVRGLLLLHRFQKGVFSKTVNGI